MNQIGEKIDIEQLKCRPFDPQVLIKQMRSCGDNALTKFWSWGVTKLTTDAYKEPKMLRFYVTGMKHKGHIYIFLNGADLYDVYFTTIKGTIKGIETDVYFDKLNEKIDNFVEKQKDYRF